MAYRMVIDHRIKIECDTPREAALLVAEMRGRLSAPARTTSGSSSTYTEERRQRVVEYLREHGPQVRNQVLKQLGIPSGASTPLFDDPRFVILDGDQGEWPYRVWIAGEELPPRAEDGDEAEAVGDDYEDDTDDEDDQEETDPEEDDPDDGTELEPEPEPEPVNNPLHNCHPKKTTPPQPKHAKELATECSGDAIAETEGNPEPERPAISHASARDWYDLDQIESLLRKSQPLSLERIGQLTKQPKVKLFQFLKGDQFERDTDGMYWLKAK